MDLKPSLQINIAYYRVIVFLYFMLFAVYLCVCVSSLFPGLHQRRETSRERRERDLGRLPENDLRLRLQLHR